MESIEIINILSGQLSELNINTDKKIILGVSGGADSTAMAHLFITLGYTIAIAHCNFNLRGKEADEDELFVEKLAQQLNSPYFNVQFDTQQYCDTHKVSTQMGARDLRYNWFKKLVEQHSYDYIAVATNKNDVVETVILNLTKGCGVEGLHGIKPIKGNIIRPLLQVQKQVIIDYCNDNQLLFRSDSSNKSLKYQRNLIRHSIIPELQKINPEVINSIYQSSKYIGASEKIMRKQIEFIASKIVEKRKNETTINIELLQQEKQQSLILHYLLKEYNFNPTHIQQISASLKNESGAIFNSSTHQILKDRTCFIIRKLKTEKTTEIILNSFETIPNLFPFSVNIREKTDYKINSNQFVACLDVDKIKLPITYRKWEAGDKFIPLGMKGQKKISDYLVDIKLNRFEKENIFVLISDNTIVWLVGHRINDDYKITGKTKKVIEFK